MFTLQYRVLLGVDHAALSTFCFVCLLHWKMGGQFRTIPSMFHPIEYQQGSPGCWKYDLSFSLYTDAVKSSAVMDHRCTLLDSSFW
jgi:hypothetical protein